MNRSIEGVVTFLQDNDSLIKQLMETAESATTDIEQLSTQVEHARDEAQVLVDQLGSVEFAVGRQDDTKVRQTALLDAVAALRKKFETYKNDPLRRGIYAAEISNLYLQLANTFNNGECAAGNVHSPEYYGERRARRPTSSDASRSTTRRWPKSSHSRPMKSPRIRIF